MKLFCRYMSVQALVQDGNLFIASACSDGVIRILKLDNSQKIILLKETEVLPNAILKTLHMNQNVFLSANTIGICTVRDFTSLEKICEITKLHQSGVNSLILLNSDIIISGGDDGTISVSNLKSKTVIFKKHAHSAHVTGLAKINEKYFVSCSVDQRISVWKYQNDSFVLFCQFFSHVPDIQDLKLWTNERKIIISVFGDGFEIFEIYFAF